jgi:PadR family transcriptional regulator AphA
MTPTPREPSVGEWACLGVLADEPAHGWAVARRLARDGDIGRIWHLSRPLTYRALDQLVSRGWVRPVAEEPGDAGPNRVILAVTRTGHARLVAWLTTPVVHLRDLRGELLLKLVFAERTGVDVGEMITAQRTIVDEQARGLAEAVAVDGSDVVSLWRIESTAAARRFLDRFSTMSPGRDP